jgi:hypothetical protein
MRKPPRLLTVAITLPFLAGCFSLQQVPLPAPPDRETAPIRGVVVQGADGSDDERVTFSEVHDLQWRQRTLYVVASLSAGAPPVTMEWPYEDLSGALARQVDVNRTSALVSTLIIGTVATIAILVTGQTDENTRLPGLD